MPRKIIIDTDPGIDDSMAIFYALKSPELEVVGLTTVFGNGGVETCTANALRLLEIAGRMDIPASQGAARPLASEYRGRGSVVHGEDGQGGVNLPPPNKQATGLSAAEFIIREVMAAPGQITLVPVGPLTNIALALHLEPRLAANLKEIVLMGGAAYVPGNITPTSEANIYNDAEAAEIVFSVDCPITMCGLDVTEKTVMTSVMLDSIGTFGNPMAEHIARILPHYRTFYKSVVGLEGIYVHDSTTISYLIAPHYYGSLQAAICVDTAEGISRGKTWPGRGGMQDAGLPWATRRPVNILVEVDALAVLQLELERLAQ